MRPVYESKSVVLSNVKGGTPRELGSPGKIYIRGRYLFINEVNKGIHVIDNTNPSVPKAVSFINIPGNLDVAVSGNYLYADMFTDMLTININDPLNAKLEHVTPNVFPERSYGNGWGGSDSSMVIVNWISKDTTIDAEALGGFLNDCASCFSVQSNRSSSSKAGTIVPGIGGSMARFAIVNNYLYSVNINSLGVFNIDNASTPVRKGDVSIGWNIETIYPFRDRLFIGSSSGMFIYNINDPSNPVGEGSFNHARACDPVVADEKYAFVTLRTGNACTGTSNQLDVLDVSNVSFPTLIKTYPLSNPHGLGKDGNVLFICDGDKGVKIYDASDVRNLKMIQHLRGITAYDVIPWDGNLIVVGATGLYQYDYSNMNEIRLLSTLKASGK